MYRRISFIFIFVIFFAGEETRAKHPQQEKIKLLILSGRNNHDWKKTTPILADMYQKSGRFDVKVTTAPDTLSFDSFSIFDVIVSNWSAWPASNYRWPAKTEHGLMQFVKQGGGFVLFHAASATFYDWPAFQQMIGSTWGKGTHHGNIVPHKIHIEDTRQPITQRMSDFWITDELWVHAGVNSKLNVLASSYSDPANKGRGMDEPVAHWKALGKGRIFHNILGHNARAMNNLGWQTLMLRGTEWAATGQVTMSLPEALMVRYPAKGNEYSWQESDTSLALVRGGEIAWQYNFNTVKGKSFFHPVNLNHTTLTWLSPDDHPWHLGLWHSWKFINGVNYWEYDRTADVSPFHFLGQTEVRDIKIVRHKDHSCTFQLEIYYHTNKGPDLMKENRKVFVSAIDAKGQYSIDYNMTLNALADSVVLDRTPLPGQAHGKPYGGYAGLSVRFHHDLFDPVFINPAGSTASGHGRSAPWKYYGLRNIGGKRIGVAIFTNPKNLKFPEPWYVSAVESEPFYYFSPAPIFNKSYKLKQGETLDFGYRVSFYSGEIDEDILKVDYMEYLKQYRYK